MTQGAIHNSQLLVRCKNGDRKAQFEIYRQYSKAMYNTSLRIVKDQAEAEDVLQESFIAAFSTLNKWEKRSTFGAWLKRIVVNKSIDAVQKRKAVLVPLEEAEVNGHSHSTADQYDPKWKMDEIMAAVDMLPDGYRIVFSLYLLEGYDHAEIGQILGISESGSKTQYHRAKLKIQKILTERSYVR